jgi:hypothetical protein
MLRIIRRTHFSVFWRGERTYRTDVVTQAAPARQGDLMDKWQQDFSSRVAHLREGWSQQFEAIGQDLLEPVFQEFSDITRRCEMQPSVTADQKGMRAFKFSLCEDAYVMLYFRPRGIDQIESDYECFLPRSGRASGVKSTASARTAEKSWAESCFKTALDDLVTRFSESRRHSHEAELALA